MGAMGRGNVFEDKRLLRDMLRRYTAGESSKSLARAFNCDHTSILYQARKHGVWVGKIRVASERTLQLRAVRRVLRLTQPKDTPGVLPPRKPYKYDYLIEEDFASGLTTSEYRAKARKDARARREAMEPMLARLRAEKVERDRLIAAGEIPRMPKRKRNIDWF